ncbi:DUF2264 domain-containing protein [Arthrobacter sp. FX8]|uniref:DUF2264 domain-containing protein n=1 Tax=Arthrobacter sp. FX8 TaxID=2997335 RepID=UPI002DD649BA|nr:DUF2264 domain-containing protein [Arthrobacter sp. FX8]
MTTSALPAALVLPPLDRELSPFTGLTREHWCACADHLLRSAHRYATGDHANLYLPGATSNYGPRSDSLEAFARTFLLASFRIAGSPEDTGWLVDWYAQGLDAGTDPANPDRWPTPGSWARRRWKPPRSRWACRLPGSCCGTSCRSGSRSSSLPGSRP